MSLETPRILVIDDDPTILQALGRMLDREGYGVDCAAHPEEAMRFCHANFYSVVIVDCLLPGKSGLQLVKDIKKTQNKNLHIVFISGVYTNHTFINSCLSEGGGSRFFSKPFNARELLDHLYKVLSTREYRTFPFEVFYSSPNLSPAELLLELAKIKTIPGYELPFLFCLLSRSKLNRQINFYREGDLICQVRWLNGNIIQLFDFSSGRRIGKNPLQNLDHLVTQQALQVQLITPQGSGTNCGIEAQEVFSWAELLTFSKIPSYWIAQRLLPLIGSKIYEVAGSWLPKGGPLSWPLLNKYLAEINKITGCSLLSRMPGASYAKEEWLRVTYNYVMRGCVWIDNSTHVFDEESLSGYLSWFYARIAKESPFAVLEYVDEKVDFHENVADVYLHFFKCIEKVSDNKEAHQWADLLRSYIKSCLSYVENPKLRVSYLENIKNENLRWNQLIESKRSEIFQAFEERRPSNCLELVRKLGSWNQLPGEFKMIYFWAQLVLFGGEMSLARLDAVEIEMRKVYLKGKFSYLFLVNKGFLAKLRGDFRTARRWFVDASDQNPHSLASRREILSLSQPSYRPSKWKIIEALRGFPQRKATFMRK